MSWEDIIKNDMEQYERDALRREKEYDNYDGRQLTEGNIRATRIAAKMAVKEIPNKFLGFGLGTNLR